MKRVAVGIMLHPEEGSQEVLLVERHPDLKFFGGYMAFPGGTLEDQDERVPTEYLRNVDDDDEYRSFVAAAAREIFEEAGIWMAKGSRPVGRSELERYRRRLLDGEVSFSAILSETGHSKQSGPSLPSTAEPASRASAPRAVRRPPTGPSRALHAPPDPQSRCRLKED